MTLEDVYEPYLYHIRALNPNANIVVAPSDHLILKEGEFLAAIEKGLDFRVGYIFV